MLYLLVRISSIHQCLFPFAVVQFRRGRWYPRVCPRPCAHSCMRALTNVVSTRIGPTNLTKGTLVPNSNASIPTVTDNLFSGGAIERDIIGVSFEPTAELSSQNGEISWGKSQDFPATPMSYYPTFIHPCHFRLRR